MREREQIIQAPDGWRLNVLDLLPDVTTPRGIVIAGHAMMVDRRTLWRPDRPSVAGALCDAGFRVLVPDQRGHGSSGPPAGAGGDWSYEDLIADTGVYIDLAQRLAPGLPITLVGHSLFGHVALAFLARERADEISAFIGLSVNIWCRRFDPTRGRWLKKRLAIAAVDGMSALFGYVPTALLRFGSADEAPTYWRDLASFLHQGVWGIPGGEDYQRGMARIACPVLYVLSDGDRLMGHPDDALAFSASLPNREVWRVGPDCVRPELRSLGPDHMPLVTARSSEPIWRAAAGWLGETLPPPLG